MKVVINEKIWCELKTNENVCHYKLYPKNVPTEYGGDSRECISGYVECESPEAAKKCMRSIKELIEGGYKKNPNWLFSLDMGDIMNHILPGKMRMFLNTSADILKNVDKAKALKEKTENSSIRSAKNRRICWRGRRSTPIFCRLTLTRIPPMAESRCRSA